MKKIMSFLAISLFTLLSIKVSARVKAADDFAGEWNITITGTPNGDATMTFAFEKNDTSLSGVVRGATDKDLTKINKIEQPGKTTTAYFNINGYDVNLALEPVDEDNIKGSLMNMFAAKSKRVK